MIANLDFLGVDAYPFWEVEHDNSIGNANATFYDALQKTKNASQGKPVWVTETGWPVSGPSQGLAQANPENAGIYWSDVTCSLVAQGVNLWYYTLQDVQYGQPVPSFGLKPGGDLKAVSPLFDLSCPSGLKPVSYILPLALSSALSPLFLLLLYNSLLFSSIISPVLPDTQVCPPCNCHQNGRSSEARPYPYHWDGRHFGWIARANGSCEDGKCHVEA